jgi:hypothetical protein
MLLEVISKMVASHDETVIVMLSVAKHPVFWILRRFAPQNDKRRVFEMVSSYLMKGNKASE